VGWLGQTPQPPHVRIPLRNQGIFITLLGAGFHPSTRGGSEVVDQLVVRNQRHGPVKATFDTAFGDTPGDAPIRASALY